jgi:hypothetical protein
MRCNYDKTISGSCPQQVLRGTYCYYHTKVTDGIIDADEHLSLMESQTIASR